MKNSLSLSPEETKHLLESGVAHVIRIKMGDEEQVSFTDMIRGEVHFDTRLVDDKVLLKADGMPTYHLAVVVDDYLMKITHAFRGEEWLPSAPVHLLLWKYLGWSAKMPRYAHLPLILGSDGSKLSKRHGSKYGFPIFAMNWTNPKTGEREAGFAERGFLPAALLNVLALLGWNDGTEQELFSLEELIQKFDLSRVSHSGAVFDFEKAKWFNHQYLQMGSAAELVPQVKPFFEAKGILPDDAYLSTVIGLIRERCHLLSDFVDQGSFFFVAPTQIDRESILKKWKPEHARFFEQLATHWSTAENGGTTTELEQNFEMMAIEQGLKKGELMLPLRIMLVGGKFGPGVFDIVQTIGPLEAANRILATLKGL